jgi:hypothetical protein
LVKIILQEVEKNILELQRLTNAEVEEWKAFFSDIPTSIATLKQDQCFEWPLQQILQKKQQYFANVAMVLPNALG